MTQDAFSDVRTWQRQVNRQTTERDQVAQSLAVHANRLRQLDDEIAQLRNRRAPAATLRARETERNRLEATRRQEVADLARAEEMLREILGRVPRVDVADADPSVPLLLLPVRLETRYTSDGRALRVRIFPDDVHIDSLDRGLTPEERDAGIAYWNTVWRAAADEAETAWRALQETVGKTRVLWVAQATQPTNLAQRATEARPTFGDTLARSHPAAVARLLPDAFTAVVIQGDQRRTQTGQPLLPEVVVGWFAEGKPLHNVHGVKVLPGAEWLVDYAEAERIGMAVTVPLARPGSAVDRLFVFGVRRSLDPHAAAAALARQLESHRCTQGLGFVPQGTPTNNTESERAGWRHRQEPPPPVLAANNLEATTNAAVLTAALGVPVETLASIEHATDREQARASAMNVALWHPSWGGFLDKVNRVTKDGATLSDRTREDTRRFHRDVLRGRGPLPALRIGEQPYGLLPVSTLQVRWRVDRGDRFEEGLLPLLRRLRERWRQCVARVPQVGRGPIDQTLRELLGSSAVCLALRVRTVLSEEVAQFAPDINEAAKTDLAVERMIDELMFEEVIANASLVRRTGSLGESRPLPLPLVHESDPAFIETLIAGGSATAQSVLQALLELAWDRARREVDKDSAGGRFGEIVSQATAVSSVEREKTLALANRGAAADAASLFAQAERVSTFMARGTPTHAEFQPVAAVSRSFGELALQATSDTARAELGLYATHAWLTSRGRWHELRAALEELKSTELEERGILFAETLDLASHRLDAWLTGVVERRRRRLRGSRPTGVMLGAYGWVERIEPAPSGPGDGGFIHAPSPTHAATAGVLRSAYLAHNADATGEGAFAIDLSSARVRTALHLIDGVRQGQPLAGLLGYRIERQLHDAELGRLVLSLRTLAPLSAGKLTDRNDEVPAAAMEALAATNVVDAIELLEKFQGKVAGWGPVRLRATLDTKPTNNPYLTGEWPKVSEAEWKKLTQIFEDAASALDAVSDLLLAESVHQLVGGNSVRAAAALDAASSGDSPPPEPEIVATPAEGVPFTHRLIVVAGHGTPWNLERPRSAAEPRLEAWAASRLGPPDTIAVGQAEDGSLVMLAETGWCALDVVYDSVDRAPFLARLRAALPRLRSTEPPTAVFEDEPKAEWEPGVRALGDILELADALRSLIAHARGATPSDFVVPNGATVRGYDADDLKATHERLTNTRDRLALHCTVLESLLAGDEIDADAVDEVLDHIAGFGLAAPAASDEQLQLAAQSVLASASRRVQSADASLAEPVTAESLPLVGQALFGDGFKVLIAVVPTAADDPWPSAHATPPEGATSAKIRRYLADIASVRAGAQRLLETVLLAEATGRLPQLRVLQLAGTSAGAASTWIGAPLPLDRPTPTAVMLSVVVDASADYDPAGATFALVVDDWVDVVPLRARRGDSPTAPIDERITTGITFNARAPSARAPQTMLLAISPDGARWTADALLDTLEETLDLAKIRAVTLEHTNGIARIIPALYEQSWSLQGEKVLNLKLSAQELSARQFNAAYVRETTS